MREGRRIPDKRDKRRGKKWVRRVNYNRIYALLRT